MDDDASLAWFDTGLRSFRAIQPTLDLLAAQLGQEKEDLELPLACAAIDELIVPAVLQTKSIPN